MMNSFIHLAMAVAAMIPVGIMKNSNKELNRFEKVFVTFSVIFALVAMYAAAVISGAFND